MALAMQLHGSIDWWLRAIDGQVALRDSSEKLHRYGVKLTQSS